MIAVVLTPDEMVSVVCSTSVMFKSKVANVRVEAESTDGRAERKI